MTERLRVLHRVIMPTDRDHDVLKLYVDGDVIYGEATPPGDLEAPGDHGPPGSTPNGSAPHGSAANGSPGRPVPPRLSADRASIVSRRSLLVPPGLRASLCTYFNAFPAAYWRRWSVLEEIVLRARVRGQGTLFVYRSTSKGHLQRVRSIDFDTATSAEQEVRLSLQPFIDGGWYWIEVTAGTRPAVLEQADWCAETGRPRGTTNIGITTYNRPRFCLDQLVALSQADDVLEVIDEILVVDQGTSRVRDLPDFPAVAAALGDRLRVIAQPNIGGSGGFSRAMEETLAGGRADYVLLLDDDVITEPESIVRAVAFADLCRTPTIVGGHMFDLYDPSVLHAYAESVAPYRWWMVPAPRTAYWHNLAHHPLRQTHWLHHRADADFNGWWMCLMPVDVLRKVGLSLPVFIKWDDIEYGVRAKAAGIATVPLPGVAVWHIPWRDKDNDLDWQAYFQERNRMISGLLHSPYERGGNMLKESFIMVTKHAMSMQYSTAELMLQGIEDLLRGPDHLHESIAGTMPRLRSLRAGFVDAETRGDLDEFPAVRRRRPPRKGREVAPPEGRRAAVKAALSGALRQVRPVDDFAKQHPQVLVPHVDQRWWLLCRYDSALVSSADGTKAAWYQRDPRRFRALIWRNVRLHLKVYRQWKRLHAEYRAALPEITSAERWRETFDRVAAPEEAAEEAVRRAAEDAVEGA
ncbi:MAG TPA: glycosyltransferase [Streptosporangiaceae bacterium]|nr:glycosyltransferase [Streptosporangiaceae bacterium]